MLTANVMAASQRFPDTLTRSRQHLRGVGAWLAVSIALHAALLLAMPGFAKRTPPPPELTVTIQRTEPPRLIPERPRERPPEPRTKPRPEKPRLDTARAPQPAPPRVLALPQQPASPEPPAFTVPAPEPVPEPAREAAAKPARQPDTAPSAKPAPPRTTDAYALDSSVRYPRTAEHGRVTLRVLVNREGRVANATLEKSSGYANLDQHALQAVRRWRFAPARQGVDAIEQSITVNVDY